MNAVVIDLCDENEFDDDVLSCCVGVYECIEENLRQDIIKKSTGIYNSQNEPFSNFLGGGCLKSVCVLKMRMGNWVQKRVLVVVRRGGC